MTDKPYPNDLLTDICEQLLEWELSPKELANLAADIPGECERITENRAEEAWERWTSRETDDSSYRQSLAEAGRGHLLK